MIKKIKEVERGAIWYDLHDDSMYLRYVIIGYKVKKQLRVIDSYPDELTQDEFMEIYYIFRKLITQMKCAMFSYNPHDYKWHGTARIKEPFYNVVTSTHICALKSLKILNENLLTGIRDLKSISDPTEHEDMFKTVLGAVSHVSESSPVKGKELNYHPLKAVYVFLSRPPQKHLEEIDNYTEAPKTGEEFDKLRGKYRRFVLSGCAVYVSKYADAKKWVADYTFPEPMNRTIHAFGDSLDDAMINLRDKMKQKAFD